MKLTVLVGVVVCVLMYATSAQAHYKPGAHNIWHASMFAWCGSNYRVCGNGITAYRVARCESRFNRWATNGQYAGLYQMGWRERVRCGQTLGRDPWSQARSAFCWWRLTGWQSWSCA